MSAAIRRFVSGPELLLRDERDRVREALVSLGEGLALSPVERRAFDAGILTACRAVDRQTAARNERFFVMLYPAQNRMVVQHLLKCSKRPHVAVSLWSWLFEFVRPEDGEILITREGLIERVGVSAYSVDAVLRELVAFGALIRLREVEPGKRGRGTARYFMNPRVGTCMTSRGERDAAQAVAPKLELVGGSARPSERRSRFAPLVVPVL